MFLLVVERGERGIYYTPLPIYVILAYNKQQYRIRVASDYRGRDHWTLSMQSPERRRHRRPMDKSDMGCEMNNCTTTDGIKLANPVLHSSSTSSFDT